MDARDTCLGRSGIGGPSTLPRRGTKNALTGRQESTSHWTTRRFEPIFRESCQSGSTHSYKTKPAGFWLRISIRRLGAFLLTQTMENRHQLGLDSYDRFSPNQDTLPKGGFGNLIAAPLQRKPRNEGKSVFVNTDMEPHPDQWSFLLGVKRFRLAELERLVAEAQKQGDIIGVRISAMDDADSDAESAPADRRLSEPRVVQGVRHSDGNAGRTVCRDSPFVLVSRNASCAPGGGSGCDHAA
jgi:hypothetical protein